MRKVNILCVCRAGLGTSLMAKMKVDKLLKEVGKKQMLKQQMLVVYVGKRLILLLPQKQSVKL